MKIIEIAPLSNGAHRNQTGRLSAIPDGWAQIPDDMAYPDTFPFVHLTVDGGVVTAMEAITLPAPEPSPTQDNPEADMLETALDHEVRMIQLELGTNTTK